ncbi:MAG TPA: GNAT family N-acetyltransferase [Anaerolineae bacterium]|nr:GNAT family N-acetyltransferase [Anaerolineae bacterium]
MDDNLWSQLSFQLVTPALVRSFLEWRYKPPYDIYNMGGDEDDAVAYFLDPTLYAHAVLNKEGQLVAFCTFGPDGQVPGGDYEAEALDIGLGVRPDLTGLGLGRHFVSAVVSFAVQRFAPPCLRVTIADFNIRAQKVWIANGFAPQMQFVATHRPMTFVILVKDIED